MEKTIDFALVMDIVQPRMAIFGPVEPITSRQVPGRADVSAASAGISPAPSEAAAG